MRDGLFCIETNDIFEYHWYVCFLLQYVVLDILHRPFFVDRALYMRMWTRKESRGVLMV